MPDYRRPPLDERLHQLLGLLRNVKPRGSGQWLACCPAHDDRKQSLSVTCPGINGGILVNCQAKCETKDVMTALGLTIAHLMPPDEPERRASSNNKKRKVATYDYTDEEGQLLYQAVRYEPKGFSQRRPNPAIAQGRFDPSDDNHFVWNLQGVRRVLYRLPDVLRAIEDTISVFVVEGEKDADNLTKLGYVATTNAGGAAKWDASFSASLTGGHVVLIPDNDEAGRKHVHRVGSEIQDKAATVRVLELPNLPPKGDVSDWLRSGVTPEDFDTLTAAAPNWQEWARQYETSPKTEKSSRKVADPDADGLPAIETNNQRLRDMSAAAMSALLARNKAGDPTLFVRAGQPVKYHADEADHPSIRLLNADALRGEMERSANWISTSSKRGAVPVAPPMDVVKDLLGQASWPGLPPLQGIVTAPVVARDGTLVTTPGYLPGAALYYHEPRPVALGDTKPTQQNIVAAKKLLLETVLGDFPFVDDASRSHALALLLLPFVRPCIVGPTPFHLIDAPTPGSGKSLLAQATSAAFLPGGADPKPAPGTDDEEWRKAIFGALLSGSSHLWIDNINKRLDSASLAGVLTATSWRDRMLGTNQYATVPVQCTWIGTGNNTAMSDELTRRTVWIRLDAEQERPWDRDPGAFKIANLSTWVRQERSCLLSATITLLRAWIEAGRPEWSGKPVGSFEAWSRVIGGILETAGVEGFLTNRDDLYERVDPEREKWCGFLKEWNTTRGTTASGTGDIIELAVKYDIVGEDTRGARNTLGRQLRAKCDRIFDGFRLVKAGEKARASQYQVIRLKPVEGKDAEVGVTTEVPGIRDTPPYEREIDTSDLTDPFADDDMGDLFNEED